MGWDEMLGLGLVSRCLLGKAENGEHVGMTVMD